MGNKQDYLRQTDALHASPALRARIAALDTPARRRRSRRSTGRYLALAACLFLAILGGCLLIWKLFGTGGELRPEPPPIQSLVPVPEPEGIVAEDIDVPEEVLAGAKTFVKETYAKWTADQREASSAEFDNWRVDAIVPCYEGVEMAGARVWLYQIDYWFHTTTPDRVLFAGSTYMRDDGWVMPSYEGCDYLVFVEKGETLQYLDSIMENDCGPGDNLFNQDLARLLESTLAVPTAFAGYSAPILPLTANPDAGPLPFTVDREVIFDFTDILHPELTAQGLFTLAPRVTERYTIHNTSGQEQPGSFYYPWAGNLNSGPTSIPTITDPFRVIPGATVRLAGAPYDGYGFLPSWDSFEFLLGEESYLRDSLSWAYTELRDVPVTVYDFTEIQGYGDNNSIRDPWSATLAVEFTLSDPENTRIFTYGIEGFARHTGADDDGWRRYSFSLNANRASLQRLILVGGGVEGWTITGYQDGACRPEDVVPGLTATLTKKDLTMGGVLEECVDAHWWERADCPLYTRTNLLRTSADLLLKLGYACGEVPEDDLDGMPQILQNYHYGRLEDLFQSAADMDRIFYYQCTPTIPANGSAVVEVSYYYYPSSNVTGPDGPPEGEREVFGYDLAATLGSELDFRSLTLELISADGLELSAQNTRLSPDDGRTRVSLPLSRERDWFEMSLAP